MTGPVSSNRVSPEQLEQLKSLVTALQEEDYAKAKQLLQSKPIRAVLDSQQLAVLYDCYLQVLLQLNDTDALEKDLKDKKIPSDQEGYILYRLEHYSQVVAAAVSSPDDNEPDQSSRKHLQAQSLVHLGRSSKALKLYQDLLAAAATASSTNGDAEVSTSDKADLVAQLYANVLATLAFNATPYCSEPSLLVNVPESLLQAEPDVALNYGILKAMASPRGLPMLQQLVIGKGGETLSQDTLERSRMSLQAARDFWRGSVPRSTTNSKMSDSSLSLSKVLHSIRQHNQALSLLETPHQALEQLPALHQKWTPLQTRIAVYNKACLQLRAKDYDACRATLKEASAWWDKATSSNKSKQPSATEQQQPSTHDLTSVQSLWWQARINVLLYYCEDAVASAFATAAQSNTETPSITKVDTALDKTRALLKTILDKLQTLDASAVRDEAILYLVLHLGEPWSAEALPVPLQSRIGIQYALGTAEKTGDWYMANRDYAAAVKCYEKEALDEPSAANRAKLVRALTHVDPERAMQLWPDLKSDIIGEGDDSGLLNGADLEQQELPRLKSGKVRKTIAITSLAAASTSSNTKQDSSKSHGAILRRRARDRQTHLDRLAALGLYRPDRPVPPDPERWLPKYERSYNRKRRSKGQSQQHRGAQGGVSEKDTQKLDVVAKQQARANGDLGAAGKSTAHLSASGKGASKKSGRKK